ncbi:hypothetical protein [Desulfoluna butyratoxydans]|uniref:Uncharacterized protein n=1 Tax=Desulfoluna butyratoxydans TaxID=231438 RepID=A0A4U8YX28_9BACT|nr:hypothetical protein [Desulfoluna butyratoxydans]VFQ45993.1 hypothetical protein MSL71_36560 [Desulfoluna butyratoxydans]
MEDMYTIQDEKRVVTLKGRRSGAERRSTGSDPQGSEAADRRKGLERRHRRVLSSREVLFERISSLTNGIALLAVGLFFLLTGLTFLPVVGLFVGGYIIYKSFAVMAEVLHKVQ